ncbi:MAG: HlyD family efflux transporter periplasmic adaptor subunit [Alphaproteobacteria bacterium]|nr:HlyD family efflux transporter periplasmic adaptor subunit [Alphaproteobacteria bacterium]
MSEQIKDFKLRPYRNDLHILPHGKDQNGSPMWLLHDMPANKYFSIGWLEFELLSRWHINNPSLIIDDVKSRTTLQPTLEDIHSFQEFLEKNELLQPQNPEEWLKLKTLYLQKKKITLNSILKHYIFFKIPLWHPDRFLEFITPKLSFIYTKTAFIVFILLIFLSVILLLREWSSFLDSFSYFFSIEGFIAMALIWMITQIIHELGHAITAKHFGLRVPVLGLAFIVLFPVMYTDTTDSWRLTSRAQRLGIGIAGIVAEMGLAILGTLLWVVLDDGALRSAAFTLASVTWITTLFININPLMRFDGYYLLADFSRIDNLQTRSFEYGKWFLRRLFLGLDIPPPETVTMQQHLFFLIYAYAVWIYRFFLFIGIALAVYYLFFKTLGIVLMIFEVFYFIIVPITKELKIWWKIQKMRPVNRNIIGTFILISLTMFAVFFPWQSHILAPALLRSEFQTEIFAPEAAQLKTIHVQSGNFVKQGDILFTLDSVALNHKLKNAELEINKYTQIMDRTLTLTNWRQNKLVTGQQLLAANSKAHGFRKSIEQLSIKAPFSGMLFIDDYALKENIWVNTQSALARLVSPKDFLVEAYILDRDLHRIKLDVDISFYSEKSLQKFKGKIIHIDRTATRILHTEILSSEFKGALAVTRNNKNEMILNETRYRVLIKPSQKVNSLLQIERGWIKVFVEKQSISSRLFQKTLSLIIRESGF